MKTFLSHFDGSDLADQCAQLRAAIQLLESRRPRRLTLQEWLAQNRMAMQMLADAIGGAMHNVTEAFHALAAVFGPTAAQMAAIADLLDTRPRWRRWLDNLIERITHHAHL